MMRLHCHDHEMNTKILLLLVAKSLNAVTDLSPQDDLTSRGLSLLYSLLLEAVALRLNSAFVEKIIELGVGALSSYCLRPPAASASASPPPPPTDLRRRPPKWGRKEKRKRAEEEAHNYAVPTPD